MAVRRDNTILYLQHVKYLPDTPNLCTFINVLSNSKPTETNEKNKTTTLFFTLHS